MGLSFDAMIGVAVSSVLRRGFLRCVKGSEPYSFSLVQVPDLGGPTTPGPLANAPKLLMAEETVCRLNQMGLDLARVQEVEGESEEGRWKVMFVMIFLFR
ncbi:hypothetical protein QN277_018007 [Acacia crassicarpa]|uniref:Uncharacterized protein n=1 Tax=Acacia crassicarpa TaxID=499986 RepID=A0AAE1MNS3_9FABA|nr:hypothetical protein QN277_018007 [Acacia crassicarpa]